MSDCRSLANAGSLSKRDCEFDGNVLLIHSPAVMLKLNGLNLGAVRTHYPKISQLTLAAIIEREFPNAQVQIADMRISPASKEVKYKEIKYGDKTVEAYRVGQDLPEMESQILWADVILFTSNFTQEAGVIGDLITYCKQVKPGARVLVGGSDAMVKRDTVDRQSYFYSKGADYVSSGDGEITLPEALRNNALPGSPTLANLDGVPFPAIHLVNAAEYTEAHEGPLPQGVAPPLMYFETSRGCRQSCDFCSTPFTKGRYRYMNQAAIKEWLLRFQEAKIKTLMLIEDNILSRLDLAGGRDAVLDWFNAMKDMGFMWEFANGVEIGKLADGNKLDKELIEAMFHYDGETGCYRSYIPLERLDMSTGPYRKLKPFDTEKAILNAIVQQGVYHLNLGVIIGNPQETPDSLRITEARMLEIKGMLKDCSGGKALPYANFFLHIPIAGTNDYRRFANEGRIAYDINQDPELFNFYTSVIKGNYFTCEDLSEIRKQIAYVVNGEEAMQTWEHTGRYY